MKSSNLIALSYAATLLTYVVGVGVLSQVGIAHASLLGKTIKGKYEYQVHVCVMKTGRCKNQESSQYVSTYISNNNDIFSYKTPGNGRLMHNGGSYTEDAATVHVSVAGNNYVETMTGAGFVLRFIYSQQGDDCYIILKIISAPQGVSASGEVTQQACQVLNGNAFAHFKQDQ